MEMLNDAKKPSENPSLDLLRAAVKEFKENPHTSEVVTQYWQAVWQVWGKRASLSLAIPFCNRTTEEIKQFEEEGRKLIYDPNEVAGQYNRHLLIKMFPEMGGYIARNQIYVRNESDQGGWFDIEGSLDSPNTDTTEKDLENLFEKQGKRGQSLNIYIIGGQDAKVQTGHYFDENSMSRLLGSRGGEIAVSANYHADGFCGLHLGLSPQGHDPKWGGRSQGSKKNLIF